MHLRHELDDLGSNEVISGNILCRLFSQFCAHIRLGPLVERNDAQAITYILRLLVFLMVIAAIPSSYDKLSLKLNKGLITEFCI